MYSDVEDKIVEEIQPKAGPEWNYHKQVGGPGYFEYDNTVYAEDIVVNNEYVYKLPNSLAKMFYVNKIRVYIKSKYIRNDMVVATGFHPHRRDFNDLNSNAFIPNNLMRPLCVYQLIDTPIINIVKIPEMMKHINHQSYASIYAGSLSYLYFEGNWPSWADYNVITNENVSKNTDAVLRECELFSGENDGDIFSTPILIQHNE
jgi:hypothetical protein